MARFAVIQNQTVSNIIIAENKKIAEEATNAICIDCTDLENVGIGITWDGINFIFPAPVVEPATK